MSEQMKMDAERAAFEDTWNRKYGFTLPEFHPSQHRSGDGYKAEYSEYIGTAWWAWQQRASLPVGVPDGWLYRINPELGRDDWQFTQDSATAKRLGRSSNVEIYRLSAPAAPTVKAEQVDREAFRAHLSECAAEVEKWPEWKQAVLGGQTARKSPDLCDEVERMVRALEDSEWAEHAGQTELGARLESAITKLINRLPSPSLPAAGSVGEEVKVVAWVYTDTSPEEYLRTKPFVIFARPDGAAPGPVTHENQQREPLMTVAQHKRIVAALSAKQSAPATTPEQAGKLLVSAEPLRQVLNALVSAPHVIRELQATREPVALFSDNPINVLIAEFNAAHGGE